MPEKLVGRMSPLLLPGMTCTARRRGLQARPLTVRLASYPAACETAFSCTKEEKKMKMKKWCILQSFDHCLLQMLNTRANHLLTDR